MWFLNLSVLKMMPRREGWLLSLVWSKDFLVKLLFCPSLFCLICNTTRVQSLVGQPCFQIEASPVLNRILSASNSVNLFEKCLLVVN